MCDNFPLVPGSSGGETSTILDYLNEDCWREVLSYVPIRDVIRTERASRRWQRVVLDYLSDTRIDIIYSYPNEYEENDHPNVFRLKPGDWFSFNRWARKPGWSGKGIKGSLTIKELPKEILSSCQFNILSELQKLTFETCAFMSDDCVKQFIYKSEFNNLQSMEILNDNNVTGQCMADMRFANLRSIVFKNCLQLNVDHLLSAADHFSRVTYLELSEVSELKYCCRVDTLRYRNLHLLLNNTPQLEYLRLALYKTVPLKMSESELAIFQKLLDNLKIRCQSAKQCDTFFEAVCQLRHLKYLQVEDLEVTGENLEAVTKCCTKLQTLQLGHCCGVTDGSSVVAAARNAGPRLTTLSLKRCQRILDDEAIECIRLCPKLERLGLNRCKKGLSLALLPRAASARREMRADHPLRLNLSYVDGMPEANDGDEVQYEELIIERSET